MQHVRERWKIGIDLVGTPERDNLRDLDVKVRLIFNIDLKEIR
jgi:hypothetical protein